MSRRGRATSNGRTPTSKRRTPSEPDAVERAADELYALAPAEFTRARDELVAGLRKQGEREAAAAVKALRKPSAPAWALNQLVRAEAADVERLIRVGERLRAAQEKLLAGGERAPLDRATREERELVMRLTRGALTLAREAGIATSAALEEKIATTLRSAALDENAAAELRAGRLDRELEAVGLFGALSEPGEGVPAGRRAAAGKAAARRRGAAQGKEAAAADERRELEQALKVARTEALRAKRELDAATKAVRGAERKAGEATRRAEEASEKAREAARRLSEARSREREAGRAHDRADAVVEKAERRLRN